MVGFFSKRVADSELKTPDSVLSDKSSFEVLRVWDTGQGLKIVLRSDVWSDPAAYGIMLADLAKHIANAYFQAQGKDVATTLLRVLEGFNAELDFPSDVPTGELQSKGPVSD
ncbi:MAG TPA: DUF5076 domain-containing protein [Nitrosomonas europaea]|uniref:DUF5076 domain-containing protein n=1 Tax=Nitrosomonas europaea TaxID=915 RepID=UPI0024911957|nr:DUF5076 domain-containing protein [Nitrosomonas europaea]HRN82637.1 DUF5076 domain-containing protein [Nitrosomonas europaea]HRO57168.1 DUF5076 domain-containing protein [Nitrosomonas europaea]HUM74930.1 DUF5076 domain-containing protein [Nitrosomonas europaea]